ncbi:T9SS type A sorting domain-containing protein [Lacinutrix jangbogonensis]|uniref:T9SS type A sorting domain-containing protein n=1 Tax=Lacinutrix jangbogonensis TaxID=1469557 RepID=UPI00053EE663|nr:T9SS type A sorting domain-containing protein [Lacinutrix jangbogonensis]
MVILFRHLKLYYGNSFTRQVRSTDLNNDGLSDIISSHSNGTIYWAENLGNNVFGTREYITGSSDNGSALDFIDANEDGYLDIVTANNYSSDNVRYILNQNGNSFDNNNPIIIDNSIQDPYRVYVKDIDNDEKDDIVVSFWTNDNMSWYRNLGNGNFSTANLISDTINNSKSFAIEDIDNDGLNDIVSSSNPSSEHKLSLFKNENNGTNFDEIIINHFYGFPNKIKISDLNNDNNEDIIVAGNDIIWFENNGTDFSSYKLISSNNNTTNQNFTDIIIEDINNDGHKDILGFNVNYISILTNNNDQTFSEQIFQYTVFRNPIYADFDGDNLKDVLVSIPTTSSEHHIGFIKRLNNNTFDTLQIIDIPYHNGTSFYRVFDMAQNDLENDGDMDIILSSSNISTIKIMRNDGSANFTFEDATVNGNIVPYSNKKIHVEDIDNDNFEDIILYNDRYDNQASYFVIIQIKNNQGNLIGNDSYIDSTGTTAVSGITFTDIDNNGYKDIFCATSSNGSYNIEETIFYYLNDGTSFQSKVYVDNQGYLGSLDRDIILEDINNDNTPDIITSFQAIKTVEYFLNDSTLSIIENETNTDDFTFYPVPFSNTLSWRSTTVQDPLSIEVYTMNGRKIFSKKDYQENSINLEFLTPGLYLIKMNYPNNVQITRKIVKD